MGKRKTMIDLYCVSNGWVSSKDIGGGFVIFIELIKRWKKMGANINIYTSYTGYKLYTKYGLVGKYYITDNLPEMDDINIMKLLWIFFRRLIQSSILLIRTDTLKRKQSVLYSYGDFIFDVFPCFLGRLKNRHARWVAPFLMVAPSPFKGYKKAYSQDWVLPTLEGSLYFVNQRISLLLIKLYADLVFPLQLEIEQFLLEKGVHREKMKKIAAGVNQKYISRIVAEEVRYDGCFVGRLHPQKGLPDLIEIWSYVREDKPDAKLAIVGKGSQKWESRLKKEIIEKDLKQNIFLLGFLSEEDKFRTMKSSKLFLFPSTYESWGIAVCEAMACGLPVIAYDLPLFRYIYPSGLVSVPIGDKRSFAKEVLRVISDENLRKMLSQDALRMAAMYGWDKIARDSFKAITQTFLDTTDLFYEPTY